MTKNQHTPSSWSGSTEDVRAQSTTRPAGQAAAEAVDRTAPRPWFKKKLLMLPLALIAVAAITLAFSARDNTVTYTSPGTTTPATADIGTTVHDGAFNFVVTGVERPGKTLLGKLGTTLTAQGEFVIVRVDVTNVGNKEQRLGCSCQFLFSDTGQKFAPSPSILSTLDALKYVQWIPPGSTVKDALVLFDVAPGTKAVHVELHDSPASQGVLVKLS
jgi:hypothetical protein